MIEAMLAVLAVNTSTTRPRPSTLSTPPERARQDEHDPSRRAQNDIGGNNKTILSVSTADNWQQYNNYSRAGRPLLGCVSVSRPRRSREGSYPSSSWRKPSRDEEQPYEGVTPTRQTDSHSLPAHIQRPERTLRNERIRASNCPRSQRATEAKGDRHGTARAPARQQPSSAVQGSEEEKRPSDEKEQPSGKEDPSDGFHPLKGKRPPQGKTKTNKAPTLKKDDPPKMKLENQTSLTQLEGTHTPPPGGRVCAHGRARARHGQACRNEPAVHTRNACTCNTSAGNKHRSEQADNRNQLSACCTQAAQPTEHSPCSAHETTGSTSCHAQLLRARRSKPRRRPAYRQSHWMQTCCHTRTTLRTTSREAPPCLPVKIRAVIRERRKEEREGGRKGGLGAWRWHPALWPKTPPNQRTIPTRDEG